MKRCRWISACTFLKPQSGGVMLELAIALPILLIAIGAIIDFSLVNQAEGAFRKALSKASRAAQVSAASSSNTDIDCLEAAGEAFIEELSRYGGSTKTAVQHDFSGLDIVLAIAPGPDNPDRSDGNAFAMQSFFTPRCLFCALMESVAAHLSHDSNYVETQNALIARPRLGGCFPPETGSCAVSVSGSGDRDGDWRASANAGLTS